MGLRHSLMQLISGDDTSKWMSHVSHIDVSWHTYAGVTLSTNGVTGKEGMGGETSHEADIVNAVIIGTWHIQGEQAKKGEVIGNEGKEKQREVAVDESKRKHLCVAVCCSVLQCVAACCSVLQRVAVVT